MTKKTGHRMKLLQCQCEVLKSTSPSLLLVIYDKKVMVDRMYIYRRDGMSVSSLDFLRKPSRPGQWYENYWSP